MEKHSQKGLGMVEIIIAIGMLGGLILGVMEMSKMMSDNTTKFSVDSDIIVTTNEIITDLSNPANCTATFIGVNALTGTVPHIKVGPQIRHDGSSFVNNLRVKSLTLSATAADITAGTSKLIVEFEKKIQKRLTKKNKFVRLYVVVDASNNITSCRALSGGSGEIWSRGAGIDIYYVGNVAIGHTAPVSALDVAGEIKFGNTASVCGPATEGQQRYSSLLKKMEFCDGTAWKTGSTIKQKNCSTYQVGTNGVTCPVGTQIVQVTSNGGDWGGGDFFTCCELYID